MRPQASRPARAKVARVRALAGHFAILGLALLPTLSCAKLPLIGGSPNIKIQVKADPNSNSCGRGNGNPLTLRVLQVTDASRAAGTTLVQLWDQEDKLLGSALVKKSEQVVDPGAELTIEVPRVPAATAFLVVGNFCRTEGSCWILMKPLEGGGGASIKLRLTEFCLTEVK